MCALASSSSLLSSEDSILTMASWSSDNFGMKTKLLDEIFQMVAQYEINRMPQQPTKSVLTVVVAL